MAYKYRPKTRAELIEAIETEIYEVQGTKNNPNWKADLNCIDTSNIIDMSFLFAPDEYNGYSLNLFNGDISNWNVSNVTDMSWMFAESNFNGDISKWDVSNVKYMKAMFKNSKFNQDINKWNVSNVKNMYSMFLGSKFNGDISKWNVSNVKDMKWMFAHSKFNQNISNWDISNVGDMYHMFYKSEFNGDIGSWPLKGKTGLENISVFPESNKLPDKIICYETIINIFIRSIKKPNNTFNIDNFKKIFKEFLNNRKELYKNKGYKPDIINKLVLNDVVNVLKSIKDKDIQKKFMKITMNKDSKEPDIEIS